MNASMHNGFALAAALSCAASGAFGQPWEYAVIDIGDFGYGASGRAINDFGEITGTGDTGSSLTAYRWSEPGPMVDLGGLPGGDGYARGWAINNLGWVAGEGRDIDRVSWPVLWRNGTAENLLGSGWVGGQANGINDSGLVVGAGQWDQGGGEWIWYAFAWTEGAVERLLGPDGPGFSASASAVNEHGVIAGNSKRTDRTYTAVTWNNGVVRDLGSLGGGVAYATGINDFDQVIGVSDVRVPTVETHAFLWEDGQMIDLHRFGTDSYAEGINNLGEVVGFAVMSDHSGDYNAFHWSTSSRTMVDLNTRSAPNGLYRFLSAKGINDAGQIIGYGSVGGSTIGDFALLLTPVHPSMTLTPTGGALVAGRMNELVIRGATPGERVYFAYSEQGGGSYIPGCTLQENALQLQNPTTLGSAVADADGVARLQRYIPRPALGKTLLLQAVVPGECAVSELIVETIE